MFYAGNVVLRGLSEQGLADWKALEASDLFDRAVTEGSLVETEALAAEALPAELSHEYVGVLRHARIPVVSYPYEWTFGMLKDAALLQLELLLGALEEGLILKDATPYNVQWRGAHPVFVDVGSFERLREGEPWAGYRQFCMLYLYPLMLQAWKDVPFQPWLRGSLDGIEPVAARNLLSTRDRFRRGVLGHVVLHSRLERRYGDRRRDVKGELRSAGFHTGLIRANVEGLRRLVRRLSWDPGPTEWSRYAEDNPYSEADARAKEEFVRASTDGRRWELAWDLGCNDGRYTRVAAEACDYMVAVDSDAGVAELLFRALREADSRTILPLTTDVADPSPNLGWRGLERLALDGRGRPELVLCLALVHHVAISGNVPLSSFLEWLAGLQPVLVIEFPTREDPMVQRLLAGKGPTANPDYNEDAFERALLRHWRIERREALPSGTRILYRAVPGA